MYSPHIKSKGRKKSWKTTSSVATIPENEHDSRDDPRPGLSATDSSSVGQLYHNSYNAGPSTHAYARSAINVLPPSGPIPDSQRSHSVDDGRYSMRHSSANCPSTDDIDATQYAVQEQSPFEKSDGAWVQVGSTEVARANNPNHFPATSQLHRSRSTPVSSNFPQPSHSNRPQTFCSPGMTQYENHSIPTNSYSHHAENQSLSVAARRDVNIYENQNGLCDYSNEASPRNIYEQPTFFSSASDSWQASTGDQGGYEGQPGLQNYAQSEPATSAASFPIPRWQFRPENSSEDFQEPRDSSLPASDLEWHVNQRPEWSSLSGPSHGYQDNQPTVRWYGERCAVADQIDTDVDRVTLQFGVLQVDGHDQECQYSMQNDRDFYHDFSSPESLTGRTNSTASSGSGLSVWSGSGLDNVRSSRPSTNSYDSHDQSRQPTGINLQGPFQRVQRPGPSNSANAFRAEVDVWQDGPHPIRLNYRTLLFDTQCKGSNWVSQKIIDGLCIAPQPLGYEAKFIGFNGQPMVTSSQAYLSFKKSDEGEGCGPAHSTNFFVAAGDRVPFDMLLGADDCLNFAIFPPAVLGLVPKEQTSAEKQRELQRVAGQNAVAIEHERRRKEREQAKKMPTSQSKKK